jgi:hypothetical protein
MAGGPQDSPIAESAKHCLAGLTSLCDTLKDPDTCSKFDLSYDESCGHVGRFRIWANNIGSLQDVSKTTSLEYRLRDAPKIIQRILELLEDINESLDDGKWDLKLLVPDLTVDHSYKHSFWRTREQVRHSGSPRR